MASHSFPSLDVRRLAQALTLYQPKPKAGASLLSLGRMTLFEVSIKPLGDGNKDIHENCRDFYQFKSTLEICVEEENDGVASLKASQRKEEALPVFRPGAFRVQLR